jgi:hypothetical protein
MFDRASPSAGTRLMTPAVDQDDALVALAHLRQVALGDHGLAAALGEHFQQRVEVLVVGPHAENAGAAVAEQRLQNDVLVLVSEGAEGARIGADQGRRHDIVEMRDEQLFRRVAHARRVIHDQRLRMDMLQDVRRRDVRHVERRILAQQHDVELPFSRLSFIGWARAITLRSRKISSGGV